MNLIKTIKSLFTKFTDSAGTGVFNIGEILAGLFMFNATTSAQVFGQDGMLNNITTVGMAFLVSYGVMKLLLNIIWNLLFGKPLEIKVGIVDKLFQHLKVNKAINYATEDSDAEEQAEQIVEVIKKSQSEFRQKSGRWARMKEKIKVFFQGLLRNKQTHAATIVILGAALAAVIGIITQFQSNPNIMVFMSDYQNVIMAVGALAAPFVAKVAHGVGIEDADQVEIRKAAAAAIKANAAKNAKAKQVEANRAKIVKGIITKAEGMGANPVTFAKNMGAMPEIITAVIEEYNKQNTIV